MSNLLTKLQPPLGKTAILGALLVALIGLTSLAGCNSAEPVYNTRFLAFGTLMDLSLIGLPKEQAEEVTHLIEQDFAYMHQAWHAWEEGPVTMTNTLLAETDPFSAPPVILTLFKKSQQLATKSDHLFNPAIGHLIHLWGFQSDEPRSTKPPAFEAIEYLVERNPRMTDITLDGLQMQSTNSLVKLDFGAIGKGYGVDMAIQRLRELGIKNAIVNAGGDLRAIGTRDGTPWRIGIKSASGNTVMGFVEINTDESVFTSGNYERNFTWEGELYHHIIDPRTGYPAADTASVTVIHSDATTADAASTALFVAGPERWQEIAENLGIQYVLLVDTQGQLHMSDAMRNRIELLEPMRKKVT